MYILTHSGHDKGHKGNGTEQQAECYNPWVTWEFLFLNTSVRCFVWWWQDAVTGTELYSFLTYSLTEYCHKGIQML